MAGRPATGRDPVLTVRLPPSLRSAIENWAKQQHDRPSRSEAIRRLIIKRASSAVVKNQAISEGMRTLRMVGIDKALEGVTTLEEIWRVTAEDH